MLAVAFAGMHWFRFRRLEDYWEPVTFNLLFVGLQLAVLTIYFSLKDGRIIDITQQLLGWGDILFFLAAAFYLSVLNFVFFYVASLIVVLFCWLLWRLILAKDAGHIPLAGFQSVLLILFLMADWWCFHFDVTADNWLRHMLLL
ncbi:magnesium-transporting ATPase (P-type) [Mucilaginibacter sp. SG538B]|nr:magnesium-transporting ATPase (P-type) [Mucilaginibacter sp. SG538B]